jgi:cbb3-type cytochrome c oxidase subunit III
MSASTSDPKALEVKRPEILPGLQDSFGNAGPSTKTVAALLVLSCLVLFICSNYWQTPVPDAARLFSLNCASCHSLGKRGQDSLFSDLTDEDWQWGNSPAQIRQSIRDGRNALMPPWLDSLSEDGVQQVAEYVATLAAGGDDDHLGKIQFDAFCIACHGPLASGNPLLGAPDLTDSVWLYGGSIEAITESIREGRQGVMPAFADQLDDRQIKLLVDNLTR